MYTYYLRNSSTYGLDAFSEAEHDRATSDATVRFFNSMGFMRRSYATDRATGYRYCSRVTMRDPAGTRSVETWTPQHIPSEKIGAREWRVLGIRNHHAFLNGSDLVVFTTLDPDDEGRVITCTWSQARQEFVG